MTTMTCDRCCSVLSDEEVRMGWPVPVTPEGGDPTEDVEYVCAGCLDGHCSEGHVLPADTEGSDCQTCAGGAS